MPTSAEATGRAGVYGSEYLDPFSVLWNPATVGFVCQESSLSGATNTHSVNWHAPLGIRLDTWGRAGLLGVRSRYHGVKHLSQTTFGVVYSEFHLNQDGQGVYSIRETSQNVTAGGGLFLKGIHAACGVTYKYATSRQTHLGTQGQTEPFEFDAEVYDFGGILELPIHEYLPERFIYHHRTGLGVFLTPGAAYGVLNYGERAQYGDFATTEPLPRTARASASLNMGVTLFHPLGRDWKLLGYEFTSAGEDLLVEQHGTFLQYVQLLGDIDPFSDVALGKANRSITKTKGFQFNFGEFLYLRKGHYESDRWQTGVDSEIQTSGYTVRLRGLLNALTWRSMIAEFPMVTYLARHVDFSYSHSRWEAQKGEFPAVQFDQLTASFR